MGENECRRESGNENQGGVKRRQRETRGGGRRKRDGEKEYRRCCTLERVQNSVITILYSYSVIVIVDFQLF